MTAALKNLCNSQEHIVYFQNMHSKLGAKKPAHLIHCRNAQYTIAESPCTPLVARMQPIVQEGSEEMSSRSRSQNSTSDVSGIFAREGPRQGLSLITIDLHVR